MEVKNQENTNAFCALLLVEFQPQRKLRYCVTKKTINYDNKDF